jgi:competence protein ComEA
MTRLTFCKAALAAMLLAICSITFAVEAEPKATQQISMLDINSADAATIAAALDGVGLTKARDIVAYREMFGNFHSLDELMEVKGIGVATVEKNRRRIIIVNK